MDGRHGGGVSFRRAAAHGSARLVSYASGAGAVCSIDSLPGSRSAGASCGRRRECVALPLLAFLGLSGPCWVFAGARTRREEALTVLRDGDRTNATTLRFVRGALPNICGQFCCLLPGRERQYRVFSFKRHAVAAPPPWPDARFVNTTQADPRRQPFSYTHNQDGIGCPLRRINSRAQPQWERIAAALASQTAAAVRHR